MGQPDLFVELFPVNTHILPRLNAFCFDGTLPYSARHTLTRRFERTFGGVWVWAGSDIITDNDLLDIQVQMAFDLLRDQFPGLFKGAENIHAVDDYTFHPETLARVTLARCVRGPVEEEIGAIVRGASQDAGNACVDRRVIFDTWAVDGEPALSLTVDSVLRANCTLQQWVEHTGEADNACDLSVIDPLAMQYNGVITRVMGNIKPQRQQLMEDTDDAHIQNLLRGAGDDVLIVEVTDPTNETIFAYPASALAPQIKNNDDWVRFDVQPKDVLPVLKLSPDERTQLVRRVSDILKQGDIVGNAYNTRTHSHLFAGVSYTPSVTFGQKKTADYSRDISDIVAKYGPFRLNPRYQSHPLRIAVINALDDTVRDFVEAMRRQLERDYGCDIEMIRERQLRVISERNIDSAVRVVEQEAPDIVLGFFADEGATSSDYLKRALGEHAISYQSITRTTVHNPAAMPHIILGILARTGSTPCALAEPLDYADYVVGIKMKREQFSGFDRVHLMVRVYTSDGVFCHWAADCCEVESGADVSLDCLKTLFPAQQFKGKRIIVHHDGALSLKNFRLFVRLAAEIKAIFYPVEIIRQPHPRLYAFNGGIKAAPWGTILALSNTDALIVTATDGKDTPIPARVRIFASSFNIGQATYSVLAWTLMDFGTRASAGEPVTIMDSPVPENVTAGSMPYWL